MNIPQNQAHPPAGAESQLAYTPSCIQLGGRPDPVDTNWHEWGVIRSDGAFISLLELQSTLPVAESYAYLQAAGVCADSRHVVPLIESQPTETRTMAIEADPTAIAPPTGFPWPILIGAAVGGIFWGFARISADERKRQDDIDIRQALEVHLPPTVTSLDGTQLSEPSPFTAELRSTGNVVHMRDRVKVPAVAGAEAVRTAAPHLAPVTARSSTPPAPPQHRGRTDSFSLLDMCPFQISEALTEAEVDTLRYLFWQFEQSGKLPGKVAIINQVWGISHGGSSKYLQASAHYDAALHEWQEFKKNIEDISGNE